MRVIFTLLGVALCTFMSFSQQISRSTLSTAGDVQKSKNGVLLSWTIGEVFSETIQDGYHMTGGFQQGELLKEKATTFEELLNDTTFATFSSESKTTNSNPQSFELTVFPNPTTEQLWIRSQQDASNTLVVNVIDTSGRKIAQQAIELVGQQKASIEGIEGLTSGNYWLQIIDQDQKVTTKQFTKI